MMIKNRSEIHKTEEDILEGGSSTSSTPSENITNYKKKLK